MERADLAGKKMPVVVGWKKDQERKSGAMERLNEGQEGRSSLELVR
jgi:hypothetical protein